MAAVAGPTQEATGELSFVPREMPTVLERIIRHEIREDAVRLKVAANDVFSEPAVRGDEQES